MSRFFIFAAKRLLFVPFAILIVVTLAFGIVNLVPSDPAQEIAGGLATEETLHQIREELGLTKSIPDRYLEYIGIDHFIDSGEPSGLLQGEMGRSFYSKRPVTEDVRQFLPNTLELVILSILAAVIFGGALGAFAAYFKTRVPDRVARFGIAVTQSIPDFLIALLLIYLVFFLLNWAPPPVGRLDLLDPVPEKHTGALILDTIISRDWSLLKSALWHSMLPVMTLGLYYSAYFAKTARSVLAVAFDSYQVEFARACGLPERQVMGYAFRQARTPIITYAGILFAALVGGAAIVETIFAWGGIGQWAITAILKLDIPAIQGFILVAALFTLVIFLILDILVIFLDPRVSYE